MKIPKLFYFKNKKAAEPYYRTSKQIADNFTVSINELYRQINPELPELKVGQEYEAIEKPFAYFRYKKQVWPVYDDDAGQQNYIYINDKYVGAGSYTSYPYDVEYFVYEINKVLGK